jgi:hypothetical protein
VDANVKTRSTLATVAVLASALFMPSIANAETSSAEALNRTMRGLGIKYLVSDDRKLPKSDRAKWEKDLSAFVDFESVNAGARRRVREAIKVHDVPDMDSDGIDSLAEKAVLFLVPRRLSDYTIAYLRAQDRVGVFERCQPSPARLEDEAYTVCIDEVSANEIRARFVGAEPGDYPVLTFRKNETGSQWRLSDIHVALTERDLLGLAMWK